ncbi:MAG TPA: MFS transporter [Candidatus Limnocylindrales bacterium]
MLVLTLDVTVLTVGLPTLAGELNASESDLQWFFTVYLVAGVAAMLPVGLLGDRYGRKTILVGGLVVFGAGSAALAYAPDAGTFIALRIVLGLAASAIIVMTISFIAVLFNEAERPRAIGIWSAANFFGLPLGPILGGWILTNAWWGWVFLINVPVALLALVAVVAYMPASRAARSPGFDVGGVLLSAAGLAALMYGIIEAGDEGWDDATAIAFMVGGLLILVLFALWEWWFTARPRGTTLLDLSLFRSRSFTWGTLLTAFGLFGLYGVLFVLPQYSQAIMSLDPQGSGLRLLPVIGGLVVGAVPAHRLAARIGAKITVAIGFAVLAIGLALGATMTAASGDGLMATWSFVAGLGGGLGFATAASAALVELSVERSGVGSATLQAVNKLAPALGAAILGSVLNASYQAQVHVAGLPAPAVDATQSSVFGGLSVAQRLGSATHLASVQTAFVAGLDDALRVGAVVVAIGVLVALALLPSGQSERRWGARPARAGTASAIPPAERPG